MKDMMFEVTLDAKGLHLRLDGEAGDARRPVSATLIWELLIFAVPRVRSLHERDELKREMLLAVESAFRFESFFSGWVGTHHSCRRATIRRQARPAVGLR